MRNSLLNRVIVKVFSLAYPKSDRPCLSKVRSPVIVGHICRDTELPCAASSPRSRFPTG
ncbi:hypothetical protein QUB70_03415 [Microcoleus sp. A003_D6]|uniref:hypothetical protein n=1 Tax=Microcoleus sp. A003_D6 TaxID=3055266 RepID=UPI002FD28968